MKFTRNRREQRKQLLNTLQKVDNYMKLLKKAWEECSNSEKQANFFVKTMNDEIWFLLMESVSHSFHENADKSHFSVKSKSDEIQVFLKEPKSHFFRENTDKSQFMTEISWIRWKNFWNIIQRNKNEFSVKTSWFYVKKQH